jgi:glyoxylase-like metal-dependent hydrolase (beta-lactamase superfamily II)
MTSPDIPVTRLDEVTRLVLAPNAGPMTLDGTNTYVLGAPQHGAVVVVDPGPDLDVHRGHVDAVRGGADVAAVVITHHHHDHAEAAGWAAEWGAPLRAFDPGLVPGAVPLRDDELLDVAGLRIRAVHTPGHASDHLCLRVTDTDVVLTGDHVLGRGTSVVNWPDGDMGAYMQSLKRLAKAPGQRIYPGHGQTVEDPAAKVQEYLKHRAERRQQILDAIQAGDRGAAQIVRRVYVDVPEFLHPAARRSVSAVLQMLVQQGTIDPSLAPGGIEEDDPSVLGSVADPASAPPNGSA